MPTPFVMVLIMKVPMLPTMVTAAWPDARGLQRREQTRCRSAMVGGWEGGGISRAGQPWTSPHKDSQSDSS